MINELHKDALLQSSRQLLDVNQVERLVRLLHSKLEDCAQLRDFLDRLYREVELLVKEISTAMIFLETEV